MPALPVAKPSIFTFSPCENVSFDIRAILIDGDPWFYATDVCAALQLTNSSMAIKALDDDEKTQVIDPDTLSLTDGTGINNLVNVINESGLYTLILRCRDAVKQGTVPHKFRKWVTNEVLPSIRKTGSYQMPAPAPTFERINSADEAAIGAIVHRIKFNFHFEGMASHAIFTGIRRLYGLEHSIKNLPASRFHDVLDLLAEVERVSRAFRGVVLSTEKRFFHRVLRPMLPFDEREWQRQMDGELAQIEDRHDHTLRLIAQYLR